MTSEAHSHLNSRRLYSAIIVLAGGHEHHAPPQRCQCLEGRLFEAAAVAAEAAAAAVEASKKQGPSSAGTHGGGAGVRGSGKGATSAQSDGSGATIVIRGFPANSLRETLEKGVSIVLKLLPGHLMRLLKPEGAQGRWTRSGLESPAFREVAFVRFVSGVANGDVALAKRPAGRLGFGLGPIASRAL